MPSPTTVLLRTQSDERLVALAGSGHERAFEAIVERYRKGLVRACRRVLPEARAEDAVQQALVAAWSALSRGDEVRELRPWLYRIAQNTALNQLRVSGYDYDELHGLLASGPAPEEELERRHVARSTLTGLAALPARQREALLATAVQGRGQDEVARAMGISEPAVRQLVHRARTSLRTGVTAITPMPVAGWLAEVGTRSAPAVSDRIGEMVAGAGGAGAVTAAKLGAVVVLATGAAAGGPGVVDRLGHGGHSSAKPAALRAAGAAAAEPRATVTPAATEEPVKFVSSTPTRAPRTAAAPVRQRRRASRRHAAARDETPAPAMGGGVEDHASEPSGSTRDRSRGHEGRSSSGGGDDSGTPSSGGSGHDGSDDAPVPVATPPVLVTPEPDDDAVEQVDEDHSGSGGGGSSGGGDEPDDKSSGD